MLRLPTTGRKPLLALTTILIFGGLLVAFAGLREDAQRDSQPTEVELITLRPAQFEPAEITRPKGTFVLFIDDRSGRENSSLVLQRVNGERLKTVSMQRRKSQWNEVVDLTPGSYVLQDANNSELRCQITILP